MKALLIIAAILAVSPAWAGGDIFSFIEEGNTAAAARLIERSPELVHRANSGGFLPLHKASLLGRVEIVALLIKHGADVNARKQSVLFTRELYKNDAPLHLTVYDGRDAVAEILLKAGADAALKNDSAVTPLELAENLGRRQMQAVLRRYGATTMRRYLEAVQSGDALMVQSDLAAHPEWLGVRDTRDRMPLETAIERGHPELVSLLLERGAAIDARALNGYTMLHLAVWHSRPGIARLLLERGADPDAELSGMTPLHLAAVRGDKALALVLIEAGADRHLGNSEGVTAAALALEHGHEALARLIQNGRTGS